MSGKKEIELRGKLLEALEREHTRQSEDPDELREETFTAFVRRLLREALEHG